MKRVAAAALLLLALTSCRTRTYESYSWQYHTIDTLYDSGEGSAVREKIAEYDSLIAPLQEILCYSRDNYNEAKPESAFSDFMVDMLRESAEMITGETIEAGLMNFGGIRTDMPKGAVRVYDVLSISPFDNKICVLTLKGGTIRNLVQHLVAERMEPLSGIRIVADADTLRECTIAGEPLDDEREYKLATIDFLVTGGDGIDFGDGIIECNNTGVVLHDAMASYLRGVMASGRVLDLKTDGRVQLDNPVGRNDKKKK